MMYSVARNFLCNYCTLLIIRGEKVSRFHGLFCNHEHFMHMNTMKVRKSW